MTDIAEIIKNNIIEVRRKIENAAIKAGRDPGEITLVAVTKTALPEMVAAAANNGIKDFAENRVQELTKKLALTGDSCRWHMIGHLQTNKIKQVLGKVRLIHSVDSIELAEAIQKRAEALDIYADILIEVNVSGEETKFGVSKDALMFLIENASRLKNVNVRGLMTIAPYTESSESVRPIFRMLRQLSLDIGSEKIDNVHMDILSMGMSNDFETAIEEGSNLIRIGRSIFNKNI
ncbi:MAG: YggS family pyridoxal phosphate-dependent enzyme [Eubacteriales bacterium]|nr:YggS family pyridoxal phosphate-dependent enzyme [Eubacteriales bacterium]